MLIPAFWVASGRVAPEPDAYPPLRWLAVLGAGIVIMLVWTFWLALNATIFVGPVLSCYRLRRAGQQIG